MVLTHSQIRYLLTISRLSESPTGVRSTDIAKALSYSRPSVCGMLMSLQKLKLIIKDSRGKIQLTELGSSISSDIRLKSDTLRCRLKEALDMSDEFSENCALLILAEMQNKRG